MNYDNSPWTYTKRNGALALFGLPFFLAGSFFFYGGLTAEQINDAPPTLALRIGFCAFSSIFIIIGLILIAGVRKFTIDLKNKTYTQGTGIFFPFYNKRRHIEEVKRVQVTKEIRRSSNSNGGSSTKTVYPVSFYTVCSLSICEFSNAMKARSFAENLAKYLKADLQDSSQGKTVTRSHDELDMSIHQREQKKPTLRSEPKLPEGPIKVAEGFKNEMGDKAFSILLPAVSFKKQPAFLVFSILFSIATIVLIIKLSLIIQSNNSGFSRIGDFMSPLFIFPIFVLPVIGRRLFPALSTLQFRIFDHHLIIQKKLFGMTFTRNIPSQEIEELEVISKGAKKGELSLVTDKIQLCLGHSHSAEDLQFIADSILWRVKS